MNVSQQTTAGDNNPWKRFADLQKPDKPTLGVAGAVFLLASASTSLAFRWTWLAALSWGLLTVGGFYLTRKAKGGAVMATVLSVIGCFLSMLSPAMGALVAAVTFGVMAGSFLQTVTRRFWLICLLSAVAAGITFAVTADWLAALCPLALLPAVLLLSVATNMGEYRTTAILYAAGGLLLSGVVLAVLWFVKTSGGFSLDAVRSLLDGWQNELLQAQIGWREEYIASVRQMIAENPAWNEEQIAYAESIITNINEIMSTELLAATVASLFDLLPAFGILLCLVPAYLSQKMLNGAYAGAGMQEVLTPESEFLTMSLPAAIIYIVTTFATLLFSGSGGTVYAVIANLSLILMLGFLVIGVRTFRTRLAMMPKPMKRTTLLMLLALACCAWSSIFQLVALYGAYERVISAIRHRMNKNGPASPPPFDQDQD